MMAAHSCGCMDMQKHGRWEHSELDLGQRANLASRDAQRAGCLQAWPPLACMATPRQ